MGILKSVHPDRTSLQARWRLAPLLLLSLCWAPAATAASFDWRSCDEIHHFEAVAYRLDSEQLLYNEAHRQCLQSGRLRYGTIHYTDPAGAPFAEKWLDYAAGVATPDFQLSDRRARYSEGARRRGSKVELNRRSGSAAIERATVSLPDNAVIDSGFDEFVRTHIGQLLQGRPVKLKFLVAGELDSFSFKAHELKKVQWNGRAAYHLRVEHDSFFVRMLLAPILLWYDAETMRLLEYRGISNIKDENGARFDARIVYPPQSRRVERPGSD